LELINILLQRIESFVFVSTELNLKIVLDSNYIKEIEIFHVNRDKIIPVMIYGDNITGE